VTLKSLHAGKTYHYFFEVEGNLRYDFAIDSAKITVGKYLEDLINYEECMKPELELTMMNRKGPIRIIANFITIQHQQQHTQPISTSSSVDSSSSVLMVSWENTDTPNPEQDQWKPTKWQKKSTKTKQVTFDETNSFRFFGARIHTVC
jgi:hypothetical protein